MKKLFLLSLFTVLSVMSSTCWAGMSNSRIRKEALYLSDKMAYELGLTNSQYDDIYEINYDFIYSLRNTMDYVVDGYEWAIDDYYDALDLRNDDLRWVLSNSQYRRFLNLEYFYRPIAVTASNWFFRIYNVYTNHSLFYMSKPSIYRNYAGGHYREKFANQSHYQNKYKHNVYTGNVTVRNDKNYKSNRNSDFGSVNIRPNTSRNDKNNGSSTVRQNTSNRRSSSTSTNRNSNSNSEVSRPSSTNSSSVNASSLRSSRNNGNSSNTNVKNEQPATSPSSTNRSDYNGNSNNRNSSSSSNRNSSVNNSSSNRGSSNSGSSVNRGGDSSTRSSSSSSRSGNGSSSRSGSTSGSRNSGRR